MKQPMGRFLLCIALVFWAFQGVAQVEEELEYLRKKLDKAGITSKRVLILRDIGVLLIPSNPELAVHYLTQAATLSNRQDDWELWLETVVQNGLGYWYAQDNDKALRCFTEAEEAYDKMGHSNGLLTTRTYLAGLYIQKGKLEQAKRLLQEGLRKGQLINSKQNLARIYHLSADLALKERKFDTLQYLYQASMDHFEAVLTKDNSNLLNLGFVEAQLAYASYHVHHGDPSKGLSLLMDNIKNLKQLNYLSGIGKAYLLMGQYLADQERYGPAIDSLNVGLALLEDHSVNERAALLQSLAEISELSGKFKEALSYQKQFIVLKETLLEQVDTRRMNEMSFQLQMEQREKKIEFLEQNAKEKESQLAQSRYYILGLVMILILGFILFFVVLKIYRERSKVQSLIHRKNEEIHKKRMQVLLNSQKLKTAHAMLEGQEMERERIARDLHDSVGSLLSAVKMQFSVIMKSYQKGKKLDADFTQADELINEACTEVRKISHNMAPGMLKRFGMVAAIENFINQVNKSVELEFVFIHLHADNRLDKKDEVLIYRIVQELVQNVIKHAQAKEATVQLTGHDHYLNILVEDDGIGMSDPIESGDSLGLKSIRDRVDYLEGKISIESSPVIGTSISINIPLKSPKKESALPLSDPENALHV